MANQPNLETEHSRDNDAMSQTDGDAGSQRPDLSAFDKVDFSEAEHRAIIVVGAGPAGFTAALYSARANLAPLLFQGPSPADSSSRRRTSRTTRASPTASWGPR